MHRNFGVSVDSLDAPINEITKARLTAEIVSKIQQYENRAQVKRCDISANIDGTLQIICTVEI